MYENSNKCQVKCSKLRTIAMKKINEKIKHVRLTHYGERGKAEIARDLEVPKTTYLAYEQEGEIPIGLIRKLNSKFGIDYSYFLDDKIPVKDITYQSKPPKTKKKKRAKKDFVKRSLFDRREHINTGRLLILGDQIASGFSKRFDKIASTMELEFYKYLKQRYEPGKKEQNVNS